MPLPLQLAKEPAFINLQRGSKNWCHIWHYRSNYTCYWLVNRASRPWGQNSFSHKPSGVIGTYAGAPGTALAQSQLRGVLCYCNSPLMNTVEAHIHFKPGLITEDGQVTDEQTADFLRNYMNELHAFIVRVLTVLPRPT